MKYLIFWSQSKLSFHSHPLTQHQSRNRSETRRQLRWNEWFTKHFYSQKKRLIASIIISERGSCFQPARIKLSHSGTKKKWRLRNCFGCTRTDGHRMSKCVRLRKTLSAFLTGSENMTSFLSAKLSNVTLWVLTWTKFADLLWSNDHSETAVWLRLTSLIHGDRWKWRWAGGWLTINITLQTLCLASSRHLFPLPAPLKAAVGNFYNILFLCLCLRRHIVLWLSVCGSPGLALYLLNGAFDFSPN